MAKYTGADCRLCRREGCKLYLKGEKCSSTKCPILTKYAPPVTTAKEERKQAVTASNFARNKKPNATTA